MPTAPALTFDITDPALVTTLTRSLGDANRLFSEDEVVYSADQLTFTAARPNWLPSPPPQVWVSGALQPASAYLVTGDGQIIFAVAVDPAAVVSVSYWFAAFDTTDLFDFLSTGLLAVEGSLGIFNTLDDSHLPRLLRDPILQMAHVRALQSLLTGNLDNYLWRVENRTVDKRAVAPAFTNAIKLYTQNIETALAWLRPQFLAEGQSTLLNIDQGKPPNRFADFDPGDLGAVH